MGGRGAARSARRPRHARPVRGQLQVRMWSGRVGVGGWGWGRARHDGTRARCAQATCWRAGAVVGRPAGLVDLLRPLTCPALPAPARATQATGGRPLVSTPHPTPHTHTALPAGGSACCTHAPRCRVVLEGDGRGDAAGPPVPSPLAAAAQPLSQEAQRQILRRLAPLRCGGGGGGASSGQPRGGGAVARAAVRVLAVWGVASGDRGVLRRRSSYPSNSLCGMACVA